MKGSRAARPWAHSVVPPLKTSPFPRVNDAITIQDRLLPLHDALFAETSPGPVKYAASLLGAEEAHKAGYSQVLWLDGVEHRYLDDGHGSLPLGGSGIGR